VTICLLFLLLGQYAEAKADLQLATDFLKNTYAVELQGYTGDNVHYILDMLKPPQLEPISTSGSRLPPKMIYDDIVPTSGPSPSGQYDTSWRRRRRRSHRPIAVVDYENGGHYEPEVDIVVLDSASEGQGVDVTYRSMPTWNATVEAKYTERYTYVTKLLKIAHGLHYIGIVILGIFVVQVSAFTVCLFCFSLLITRF